MAYSGSDDSLTSSNTSSPGSEQRSYDSSDTNVSDGSVGKADEIPLESEFEDLKQMQRTFSDALKQQSKSLEPTWKQQNPLALHRGLEAIASSLSLLTNTLGMALEERRNFVEMKANSLMHMEPQGSHLAKSVNNLTLEKHQSSPPKLQVSSEKTSEVTKDIQVKTSRDVAMAMATKAKLLLRQLKGVKQDLIFTKDRCAQLEEENKQLRESIDKGVRHEEDDLVRLQLEALLTEKARLAQENAAYARENQFLHEVVQYHQLKLRSITLPDETMDDDLAFEASAVDMDFVPFYPNNIDLEESFKIPEAGKMSS